VAPPEGYVKAKLAIEGGETIQVLFNPTEYTITKGNNWTFDPIKGTSLPTGKFGGGKPREMQVNLLLDQSLPNGEMSVKDITDKLFKMMEVKGGTGAGAGDAVPPLVTFQWGEMIPFKAACTSLTVAFQLFKPNGSPIRADVKLALTQAETATSASAKSKNKKQNPTTRSHGGLGVHVVQDGDTLQSVAHQTYGDPNRWRLIAEANGIDNPLHLRRGKPLNLPRLD
jgi:Contractile injection system tube protein/LysM domain